MPESWRNCCDACRRVFNLQVLEWKLHMYIHNMYIQKDTFCTRISNNNCNMMIQFHRNHSTICMKLCINYFIMYITI